MAENLATLNSKARGNRIMVCSWLQCVKESVKKADTVKKGKSDGSEVAEMVCKRPRQQWIEAGERADTWLKASGISEEERHRAVQMYYASDLTSKASGEQNPPARPQAQAAEQNAAKVRYMSRYCSLCVNLRRLCSARRRMLALPRLRTRLRRRQGRRRARSPHLRLHC